MNLRAENNAVFVVCGEALWDFYASGRDGLTFDARPGGSPFNVAIGLARLGVPVSFLGGVSTDRLGARLRALLDVEGIGTELVVRSACPTALSLVELGADGLPDYVFYGAGTADRAFAKADLPDLGDAWGVHAGSFSLVTEPVGSSLLALLKGAAGRKLVTLDPNVRPTIEPDLGLWRARVGAFIGLSDLVKVSTEDLGLLCPGKSVGTVAKRWLGDGPTIVVVTSGASGAEAFGGFGRVSVPASPVPDADTVGAGDSFMAALIAGLADRDATSAKRLGALGAGEVEELLTFAGRAAAITCARRGADPPARAHLWTTERMAEG